MNPKASNTHEHEKEYFCQNNDKLEERMGYLEMAFEEMFSEDEKHQEDKMFPKTTDAWA